MVKTLELAFRKAAALPDAAQEHIARELIDYVDKLSALRADLESGVRQLDAGEGRELDVEAFLRRMHEQHRKV
jgi:Arc/MetJ-type ribon-helix-helix transcriptional regulator